MIVPDRTTNRFRIDGLSLKASATRIGRHLHACFLTSLFAVILSMLFVTPASAAITCKQGDVGKVLSAGTIVIPMNAPSGTVVSTVAPAAFQMLCTFSNGAPLTTSATSTIRLEVANALAPGFADVYKTAIDGLGIRYVFNAPACDASNLSLSNGLLRIPCFVSGSIGGPYEPTEVTVTAIFVAYGTVKAGATTLSSIPELKQGFESSDSGKTVFWGTSVYTGSASGTINTATCSVQTETKTVELPTPAIRAFAAGVGTVAGRKAFELNFTCSTGAKVSIVITDAVTPSNRTSTLTLTPDSTVAGIGLQVLKGDGTPVVFGPDEVGVGVANQWLIGDSPNGALVLPLSAQYIRTGTVTPGSLRALATFTMSYN
jgi:type 1 fimbria pilin